MKQPSGRHRRPHRTMAGRVWQIAAALLAMALTYVFVPPTPTRIAIEPAPERPQLPPVPPDTARTPSETPNRPPEPDPDKVAGALIRPYMPLPPPGCAPIPRSWLPEGDLLASPAPPERGEFYELASLVRVYLDARN